MTRATSRPSLRPSITRFTAVRSLSGIGFDVNPSPHDLEDTYLPAFRATVVEGHADSVMCAYNAIDNVPACANTYLLQHTLRDAWKFDGYVVSDCGAIGDITAGHKYTPDNEHGSAAAVLAGTDLYLRQGIWHAGAGGARRPDQGERSRRCGEAALHGSIQDGNVRPAGNGGFQPNSLLARMIRLHDRELALRAARESIVLLKNHDHRFPSRRV